MPRDYKSEYENYHSKSDQKKDRAGRNGARRMLKKKYGNSLLGKDVDHKDRNPRNNNISNLRVQSKSVNRSRNQ
jgi:hypothetical protein